MSQSAGTSEGAGSTRGRVAIVGMGCRFAGAPDLHAYWRMILEGRDGFGPVPPDRWPQDAFYSDNPRHKDKSTAPAGAFIDDVRSFPAVALGVPPRRVEVMDPQQRMALEVSLDAAADAGWSAGELPSRTGVYMGVTAVELRTLLAGRILAQLMATGTLGDAPDDLGALGESVSRLVPPRPFTAPGVLANMTAATIAQELRLRGPAFTSDAACASALVSIADAVYALREGRVDCALAGGVYICLTPEHHIAFSRIGAMSRQGRCLPFDANADGFVQGDGCGVLVLRRLDDALADGARIYATIDGIAMNNDGGGEGPMAPVAEGQEDVIRLAWQDAARSAASLGYLEAHGTGTTVGDRTELAAAGAALEGAKDVTLGSSKGNVGHTMSAAGVAGVIRAALAIHTRTLPPMAGFESAKPELGLAETAFRIPTTPAPWAAPEPVAAVSSFGFGGTNVHAVLAAGPVVTASDKEPQLVLMSGPDAETLTALAAHTADAIEADPTITVAGVARAWAGRAAQPARLSVVASTRDELIAGLRDPIIERAPDSAPRIAFMYPGQGSQRLGMIAGIRDRFPVVAETLRQVDSAVDCDLHALLYPAEPSEEAAATLTATEHCQPALLAVGTALTALLKQVGIRPDEVLGHSVGEFTAAVAAGVLGADDGARWVRARGRAMAEMTGDRGAMLALRTTPAEAEALLVDGAVLANLNHPKQCVLSGASDAIATVAERAEAAGIKAVPLSVSHGFHSPVFEALDLGAIVDALPLQAPQVDVVSCIKDGRYTCGDDARQVFRDHATAPVEWVRALGNATADVFLQVGAGGPLLSFARAALRGKPVRILSLASTDDADGGRSLLRTLGQLWQLGLPVDVRSITAEAPLASVPPRILPREVYWPIKDQTMSLDLVAAAPGSAAGVSKASEVAPTVASTGASAGSTISSRVFEAVARASAYPVAALRAEMSLTDDLGFDSMMLAELTTELSAAIEGLAGIPQELLINRPTIGDLVRYAEAPDEAIAVDDDAPLTAFEPVWQSEAPRLGEPRTTPLLTFEWFAESDSSPVEALLRQVRARAAERPDVLVVCRYDDPWAEGLSGVVRGLAAEWPDAVCKCIRSAEPLPEAVLDAERRDLDRAVDVCLRGRSEDGRQVLGMTRSAGSDFDWNPADEVVLVTGGTRGIGARYADRLESLGATVFRLGRAVADVRDEAALTAWLAEKPPVTTLVHAAGILADGAVEAVDEDTAATCRAIKTDGLKAAIAACGASLRTVQAIGSWAGRFGNRHQVHYGAANALMAGLIEHLPKPLRGVVSEFGPWTDTEMVAGLPEAVISAMRASGIDFVGTDAGLDALLSDLQHGQGIRVHGRRVPDSLSRVSETTTLSTETHPYLLDHAIDDRPVLPLAGAAAMMSDAIGRDAPLTLTDLTLYSSVAVTTPRAVTVRVDRNTAELHDDGALAYRAVFELAAPDTTPERWREGGEAPSLSLESFYAEHTFHGPLLQGIETITAVGNDFIQGTLRPGRRSDWIPGDERPWRVDPLVLDSAMQLTAHVAWTRFGRAGTPVSIGTLHWLAPLDDGSGAPLRAQAVFEPGDGDRFSARLSIWRADGELVLDAHDVVAQLREVSTEADTTAERSDKSEATRRWANPAEWPEYLELKARQAQVAALGVDNPYFDVHEGTARDTTRIAGRDVINYSSYNYLGLSGDQRIREAVTEAMARYGTSVSASRVACGERPFHGALERGLAAAQGVDDALIFPSGHATNVTTIGHLFGPKDLIVHDELIHDSCLQGIKLSGAARRGFRHDDPSHLRQQIAALRGHYEKCLILIEGVYSMDGDVPALPEYVAIKEEFDCLLMIDEAHSFGTIGATGRGISEHFGIAGDRVDIWMGTLSKSLASMGGWIAGRKELIEYLRYTTPGFVFAAGMAPTLGQSALSALQIMQAEPWRVQRLQHNSRFFCEQLRARGINTGDARGESPVVPVITGDSALALRLSDRLLHSGINAKPIIFPAVAEDAARLRFFLTTLHTEAQLTLTAERIAELLDELR